MKPTLIGPNMISCKFGSIEWTITCTSKVSKSTFFSLIHFVVGFYLGSERRFKGQVLGANVELICIQSRIVRCNCYKLSFTAKLQNGNNFFATMIKFLHREYLIADIPASK